MIIRMIMRAEVAILFATLLSFIMGIFFDYSLEIASLVFLSSLFGIILAPRIQTRSSVIWVSFYRQSIPALLF